MKIFRLSLFNLKKNKREAAAILFLTLISSFLLGAFLSSITNINKVFDESYAETGSKDSVLMVSADKYRDVFQDILNEEYGIDDIERGQMLYSVGAMLNRDDEKLSFNLDFVTESTELCFEDFRKGRRLSDSEIEKLSHPIWLPEKFEISAGYKPGDIFVLVACGRDYPFEIAGFYNCGLFSDGGVGFKCVISDHDYTLLTSVYEEKELLIFNASEGFSFGRYFDKCYERTGENVYVAFETNTKENVRENQTTFLSVILYMSGFVSVITMAAVLFLIGHKITRDIEDQMQQIGVLEALGYTSNEISLSYVCEYVLSGGIGSLSGGIAAVLVTPAVNGVCTSVVNRTFSTPPNIPRIICAALIVALTVVSFAAVKAGRIRKIPPVTAFRRGIKTHHFGRNIFPLEKLRKSIDLRLALKGIFSDIGAHIGACGCIILAGTAVMFSVYTYGFFSSGIYSLFKLSGMENSDETITLMNGVDAQGFREELLAMSEVRKVNLSFSSSSYWMKVKGSDQKGAAQVFDNFNETENIFVKEGRFPQFDNEIMISLKRAVSENRNIGDSIVIVGDGGEKSYIITGIVPTMSNSGMNLYFTTEGFIRANPNARPNVAEIYLNDGTDVNAFEKKMTALYGANAKDTAYSGVNGGTLEERIRAAADEKMAVMISRYGITDIDYAVKIGDTVITGNSSKFVIREMQSTFEQGKTEIKPVADIIKAFCIVIVLFVGTVVAVMLGIISSGAVKRQRKEFGIMKSMGYTSKNLMIQISLRILPSAVISSLIASFFAARLQRAFWLMMFGVELPESLPLMICTAAALVLFCLAVSFISAGRIRKISVTELVTE